MQNINSSKRREEYTCEIVATSIRGHWINSSPPGAVYVSVNWVSIGSGNGLLPVQRQAITCTNTALLSIGPLGTNFVEMQIEIQISNWRKCIWKYHLRNGGHFVQDKMS